MSIISIKGTEKCIVYKLRSLVVKSFVIRAYTSMKINTQRNSNIKAFTHYTTVPRINLKFEVLKPDWVK